MADNDARERLLDLLDKKAFDPVLNTSPDDYQSDKDKKRLKDVQETTRSTQHSYHAKYKSAGKVVEMYRDDLSSSAAQKVHDELRGLGLPTLNDIKGEFEKLADQLDVKG